MTTTPGESPAPPESVIDAKHQAMKLFEDRLAGYSTTTTVADVASDTRAISAELESGEYMPYSTLPGFLLQYYGQEVLAKLHPSIQRAYARIVPPKDGANFELELVDARDIPPVIQGHSIDDIVATVADGMLQQSATLRLDPEWDRAAIAEGHCGVTSSTVLSELQQQLPGLRADYVRLYDASRRLDDDTRPPQVVGIGEAHSFIRIPVPAAEGQQPEYYLHLDPTIAQVDQTDDYDIEFAMVPAATYNDFIRLRYQTFAETDPIITPGVEVVGAHGADA